MSDANEFTLNGGTEECSKTGMWRAEILLITPDGQETKLDSGFVYRTKASAQAELDLNLNRIIKEFRKDGVEIVSRNGLDFQ